MAAATLLRSSAAGSGSAGRAPATPRRPAPRLRGALGVAASSRHVGLTRQASRRPWLARVAGELLLGAAPRRGRKRLRATPRTRGSGKPPRAWRRSARERQSARRPRRAEQRRCLVPASRGAARRVEPAREQERPPSPRASPQRAELQSDRHQGAAQPRHDKQGREGRRVACVRAVRTSYVYTSEPMAAARCAAGVAGGNSGRHVPADEALLHLPARICDG